MRDGTGEIKVYFEGDVAGYIPMGAVVRIVNGFISLPDIKEWIKMHYPDDPVNPNFYRADIFGYKRTIKRPLKRIVALSYWRLPAHP
jgi:hypothetical protein